MSKDLVRHTLSDERGIIGTSIALTCLVAVRGYCIHPLALFLIMSPALFLIYGLFYIVTFLLWRAVRQIAGLEKPQLEIFMAPSILAFVGAMLIWVAIRGEIYSGVALFLVWLYLLTPIIFFWFGRLEAAYPLIEANRLLGKLDESECSREIWLIVKHIKGCEEQTRQIAETNHH